MDPIEYCKLSWHDKNVIERAVDAVAKDHGWSRVLIPFHGKFYRVLVSEATDYEARLAEREGATSAH